mgnify:CR=1 FL=1|tara:strand:- start:975 stop:1412 length:438 start_codon:yes stop_codon:yes gene_type:complete
MTDIIPRAGYGRENVESASSFVEACEPTVLYDGDCPLCRREIAWYRGLKGAEGMRWVDVRAVAGETIAPGVSLDAAVRRFHVISADGNVRTGGYAFVEIWRNIPCLRPLAFLFRPRACAWLLNRVYDLFLRIRPGLQRLLAAHGG